MKKPAKNAFIVAQMNVPAAHLKLGEYCKTFGGAYAGAMRGESGQPDYYLFVAVGAHGENASIEYGGRGFNEAAASHPHDGLANTLALASSATEYPAAKWARGLVIDGFGDYYLPAREELRFCFINCLERFDKSWHWSSSQYAGDSGYAWGQYFDDGYQSVNSKAWKARARAVRRVIINSIL